MNRWCLGLPFARSRSIADDEAKRYTAELARIRARLKYQLWLFALALAITVIISFPFAFETSRLPGSNALIVSLSVLGIWLLIGGVAGSAGEIIFGSRLTRMLFAVSICGLLIAFSFKGAWTEAVGTTTGIFVLIGGNAMLVRQFQERRRTKRIARHLHEDLKAAAVWRFELLPATGEEDPAAVSGRSVDVFPVSNIVLAVDDRSLSGLKTAVVATIPSGGTGTIDAPLRTFAAPAEADSFDFRQRHLTDYERSELALLVRRERKGLLVRAVIQLWAATVVVNALDASMNHRSLDLNLKSALIGIVLAVSLMWNRARAWWCLRLDWLGGILVVVRPKDTIPEGPALEQLPRSGRIWSDRGAPAPWRVRPGPEKGTR
jgi:hypothetical protein